MNHPTKQAKPGLLPGHAIVNVYTVIAIIYCFSFSLLFYVVAKNVFLAVIHVLALVSVVMNFLVLKKTNNFQRSTNIIMATGTVVVVSLFATGGWDKTGFLWPFAYLPFAFFLSERKNSMYWIYGLVAGCAIVVVLQLAGLIAQPYSGVALFNFFAALLIFIACNYFFKKASTNYKEVLVYTRNLLESSIDPFFTIDQEGRIVDVNSITVKITGVPYNKLVGSDFGSYFTEPERAREICNTVFTGGIAINFPLAIRRLQGEPLDVLFNAVLYRDEQAGHQRMFAMARDITERKKLEVQLKKFNEELEQQVRIKTMELGKKAADLATSNADLEQFAYIASHDLQEPLNTTSGFASLLKQQYGGKLDKEADQYLAYIVQASDRMKTLIRELLEYSRIGRKKELQRVDCNSILHEVLADLDSNIKKHQATVSAATLPVINAYATELKLLFQNLISNAIKFRKEDVAPHIQIAAERTNGYWQFSFSDNGIGIDEAHGDKIFIIFKRLHTRTQYEGTGIGLAHCKKIVELHGGKIWVHSTPGKGSTFYFTIQCLNWD